MDYRATILLYAELLLALALLRREGLLSSRPRHIIAVVMVGLAFALRYCCLPYETLDYQDWLRVWLEQLRQLGSWHGLGQEIWSCNYNPPYLYFLALVAKISVPELLCIKLFSILFDLGLAFMAMRLVGLFTRDPERRLIAFIGVLWLPTVYLNGAYWGQCDAVYAFFALLSVYLLLDGRPGWSAAAMAVSISFKLQGIFLLPVYPLYILAGRMKLRHLLAFPAAYLVSILPAVLAGRDLWELLTLYVRNTGSIGDGLNYNSSSLYALLDFSALENGAASKIGILLAFFLCAGVYGWFLLRREEIDDRALLGAAVLFCVGVPFLLPHMHDRYFFMADVLCFVLAVCFPAMFPLPLLVSFGSFLGYYAYLRMRFLYPMRWGGAAMGLALLLAAGFLVYVFNTRPRPEKPAPEPAE